MESRCGHHFFFVLRVLFNVLAGAARPLADARRVAGREWVIRSPVREQPLGAWVETAWTGTWEKFEVPREANDLAVGSFSQRKKMEHSRWKASSFPLALAPRIQRLRSQWLHEGAVVVVKRRWGAARDVERESG